MRSVELELAINADDKLQRTVAADFQSEEIDVLTHFVRQVSRVRECTLLVRGMRGLTGINFDNDGIKITAEEWSRAELHDLLHVLRPVMLEEERAGFTKVVALLKRRLEEPAVRQYLKIAGRVFRDGELSLYLQIKIGSQPLFAESLLRTWLYGTQYHTDSDKALAWSKIESALGEPNALALMQAQLHGKVLALLNVDYVARQVILASRDG